jgi:hypothetical protein
LERAQARAQGREQALVLEREQEPEPVRALVLEQALVLEREQE